MPICLCFKLPLTSLGEHQKAPKHKAKPISKRLVIMPRIIGIITARLIKIALLKLVLLKKFKSSLELFKI
ncbi:hypothetical protein CLV86_2227 [Lacinutrix venerupis]|nr:hypothetical protein CLV86_2227 [Lacinutrix venerupis]